MTIKVGDRVPDATLFEFIEVEGNGCSIGPNAFKVADIASGKKIAVFGLPGAFTPTCSAQHVPSYVKHFDALKAKGIAEFTKKLGLELDLTGRGMGVRMQRFSMVIDNGVVSQLNIEAPGKYEASSAEAMLAKL